MRCSTVERDALDRGAALNPLSLVMSPDGYLECSMVPPLFVGPGTCNFLLEDVLGEMATRLLRRRGRERKRGREGEMEGQTVTDRERARAREKFIERD